MNRPKRVVILGGGSAGWMAAAYLDAALNQPNLKVADITLVESPDVPRIGVGEATIPSINHILAVIGINEVDFLTRVDGTFKHAIKYNNWLDGDGDSYYHAFGRRRMEPIDYSATSWLRSDRSIPFSEAISSQPALCESCIGPHSLPGDPKVAQFTYAFHINALGFADYLCEIATARGVQHHRDHMTEVEMADDGNIAAINTRGGLRVEGDLFIDCTGFAALLIEKQLGVDWVDCSQWLLSDRAVTIQLPYEVNYPGYVRPNTLATAVSAGWIWEIPLQTRRAWGYVHSSSHVNEDEAERELREFIGPIADDQAARFVPFKVGYRSKSWVKNCIAIGLSAGFIEPLEATALDMVQETVVRFIESANKGNFTDEFRGEFNDRVSRRFDAVRDYIVCHYRISTRTDTEYWRDCGSNDKISRSLHELLTAWMKGDNITDILERQNLDAYFPNVSWNCLLAGKGIYPSDEQVRPGNELAHKYKLEDIAKFRKGCALNFKSHQEQLAVLRD